MDCNRNSFIRNNLMKALHTSMILARACTRRRSARI